MWSASLSCDPDRSAVQARRCVSIPVRAEHTVHGLLDPPVDHIGNTKATLATAWLRNPHPANHPRAIGSRQQAAAKHWQELAEMRTHLVDASAIQSWAAGRRPL